MMITIKLKTSANTLELTIEQALELKAQLLKLFPEPTQSVSNPWRQPHIPVLTHTIPPVTCEKHLD